MTGAKSPRATGLLCQLVLGSFLASTLLGCGLTSSARVRVADVRTKPPAEVELVVSVHDTDGPVTYLEQSSFFVSENDVELDPALHPVAFGDPSEISTEVLILVDTSKKDDPLLKKGLERGLSHLVEKLGKARHVHIVGFDGGNDPSFQRTLSPGSPSNEGITLGDGPADKARNLNGALAQGFDELSRVAKDESPFFGILVVVSFGPDTAGRLASPELWKKLDSNYFPIYSAVPSGVSVDSFGEVERIEFTREDLSMRLMDLGMLIRSQLESLYLLRYCSSARSGARTLAVRVRYEGTEGTPRGAKGSARKTIDTSGFRAGCQVEETTTPSDEAILAEVPAGEADVEPAAPQAEQETPVAPESAEKASPRVPPRAKPSRPAPKPAEPKPVVAPPSGEDYR